MIEPFHEDDTRQRNFSMYANVTIKWKLYGIAIKYNCSQNLSPLHSTMSSISTTVFCLLDHLNQHVLCTNLAEGFFPHEFDQERFPPTQIKTSVCYLRLQFKLRSGFNNSQSCRIDFKLQNLFTKCKALNHCFSHLNYKK